MPNRTVEAILLVNAATETDWFQRAFQRAHAVCFPDGRIQFVHTTRNGDHPVRDKPSCTMGHTSSASVWSLRRWA